MRVGIDRQFLDRRLDGLAAHGADLVLQPLLNAGRRGDRELAFGGVRKRGDLLDGFGDDIVAYGAVLGLGSRPSAGRFFVDRLLGSGGMDVRGGAAGRGVGRRGVGRGRGGFGGRRRLPALVAGREREDAKNEKQNQRKRNSFHFSSSSFRLAVGKRVKSLSFIIQ